MTRPCTSLALLLACIAAARAAARADDWPQWMGPRRDAVWREPGVARAIRRSMSTSALTG